MYAIDLLKGEGIPFRSRPGCIAFASTVVIVPLITAILVVGVHLDRQVTISIQKENLSKVQRVLGTLTDAMDKKRVMEARQASATALLGQIKTVLTRHAQWSGVLATVVENLPEALVLTRLEAKQDLVRRKIPSKDDPKASVEVTVPAPTLAIGVCGYDGNVTYRAVRDLQDRLRASPLLGPRLDAVMVSQESGVLDGADVVSYELSCVFKAMTE
jgi:hypothetical protein